MPPAYNTSHTFALEADAADALASLKQQFHFPKYQQQDVIYFCGNSLGLQPKNTAAAFETELSTWRGLAVEGYFKGQHPWLHFTDHLTPALGKLTGAQPHEITVMNALTVNLHLMMQSFYKPSGSRYKIMMEAGAFPSDQYAVETQVKQYGYHPADAIIEIAPREGEKTLHEADILAAIAQHGASLALVLFGGIQYYTGQLLPIQSITAAARKAGAVAGWDLAHVTGNVPVQLHNWDVDFAVWCSYKYLNSGPGAAGGVFVHEKHAASIDTPRLGGWWGNDEATRFKMEKGFIPKTNAGGWNLSTTQVFNMVALKASLEIFEQTSIEAIREKSIRLTGYLEYLLQQSPALRCNIITPADPAQRGAQLSLFFPENGRLIHNQLTDSGIVADYREPGVIRLAPAPLYCSFSDVHRFYTTLQKTLA
ncbi:kynureninase [Deminuibacter soli]|uniref:Kynureninase n=1 Tax=Deminuibacter soli TaxID=2291815 RepID=A0A3E1NMM6_9BACT|nr:kynureninase [Deminuibacter soli]RFM29162.1 kynureninase [Deminuibacter soli]